MLATWIGVGLALMGLSLKRLQAHRIGLDFALGAMTASAAFALVGPQLLNQSLAWSEKSIGLAIGLLMVGLVHLNLTHLAAGHRSDQGASVLAWVLILHGLPEGMASGAALAGLRIEYAVPILGSIALQNLPEGLLVVVLLRSLGFTAWSSAAGGLASGAIELLGGAMGGLALSLTERALPDLMLIAGGAMLASVAFEVIQRRPAVQFALGFGLVTGLGPLLDLLP
jgi:ZIP family zinc transporter